MPQAQVIYVFALRIIQIELFLQSPNDLLTCAHDAPLITQDGGSFGANRKLAVEFHRMHTFSSLLFSSPSYYYLQRTPPEQTDGFSRLWPAHNLPVRDLSKPNIMPSQFNWSSIKCASNSTNFLNSFPPMTDPPENVLINASSDKLNLIEGSNGPTFTCEASGEPKVHYRWFLRSTDSTDNLVGRNFKRSNDQAISSRSGQAAHWRRLNEIPLATPKLHDSVNQTSDSNYEDGLIELVGTTTEHEGGVQISTLDLSAVSMDKSQSGQYICEASNKLGRARHSIHVNILCKYLNFSLDQ